MSRIRTIKPDFWSSEQVMNCSRDTRLFFIGLWNFADDEGRLRVSEKTLKAQIFPGDLDVESSIIRRMLVELSTNGLIKEYEVDGVEYCFITGWHHQRIDRPHISKIPPPPIPKNSTNDRRAFVADPTLSNPILSNLKSEAGLDGSLASREGTLTSHHDKPTSAPTERPQTVADKTREVASQSLAKTIRARGWVA